MRSFLCYNELGDIMDKWEKYLIETNQKNYNLEKLNSLKENNKKQVYKYVQI